MQIQILQKYGQVYAVLTLILRYTVFVLYQKNFTQTPYAKLLY